LICGANNILEHYGNLNNSALIHRLPILPIADWSFRKISLFFTSIEKSSTPLRPLPQSSTEKLKIINPISGNALERMQQVRKPAGL
jgi:hypothetical protein